MHSVFYPYTCTFSYSFFHPLFCSIIHFSNQSPRHPNQDRRKAMRFNLFVALVVVMVAVFDAAPTVFATPTRLR